MQAAVEILLQLYFALVYSANIILHIITAGDLSVTHTTFCFSKYLCFPADDRL